MVESLWKLALNRVLWHQQLHHRDPGNGLAFESGYWNLSVMTEDRLNGLVSGSVLCVQRPDMMAGQRVARDLLSGHAVALERPGGDGGKAFCACRWLSAQRSSSALAPERSRLSNQEGTSEQGRAEQSRGEAFRFRMRANTLL